MTDEPRITAAEAMRRAESLADRMNAANERRKAYREKQDDAALDRPRNATDERLDDAIEAGDVQRLAALADRGIIDPNDARMAADVVKYDHPENRTRSVWMADRTLTEARFPHRMDQIAREVSHVQWQTLANPEVHHRIWEAMIDKSFDSLRDWDDSDVPVSLPEQTAGAVFRAMDASPPEPEPDRPVERLVQGLRL